MDRKPLGFKQHEKELEGEAITRAIIKKGLSGQKMLNTIKATKSIEEAQFHELQIGAEFRKSELKYIPYSTTKHL